MDLDVSHIAIAPSPTLVLDSNRPPTEIIAARLQILLKPLRLSKVVEKQTPDRECGTAKARGEFSIADNGEERYKAFITRS